MRMLRNWRRIGLWWMAVALCVFGCGKKVPPVVTVYTALDEEFSKPIFEEFTKATQIEVRSKYDAESTKTVGLTEAILAERQRPRCDLFWNNEILNTLRLERAGLLRPYHSARCWTIFRRKIGRHQGCGTASRRGREC